MSEIRTVSTLRHKRDEVAAAITAYEKKLEQARADLAHLSAAIAIFEACGDVKGLRAYVDLHRVFRYGEVFELARNALESGAPLSEAQGLCRSGKEEVLGHKVNQIG